MEQQTHSQRTDIVSSLQRTLGPDAWKLTPATYLNHVTQGKWVAAPHLLYISSIVASRVAQGNGRIIVSLPPRHGKSEMLSVGTPQWFLENYQDKHVILTSHTAELSTNFSRRVRDEINIRKALLTVRLRPDASKMSHFITTRGGSLFSAGVGGPITGRGAHLLLVDDYLKTSEEAESPTIRGKINDWFKSTALTRLEPGGTCIILATRWHKYDLIGSLLGEQDPNRARIGYESVDVMTEEDILEGYVEYAGEEWEYIELPAFAYESQGQGDPLGREPGEALWPWRYPKEYLERRRRTLGRYFWVSLYQQRPISRSEWLFDPDKIRYVDVAPDHDDMRWVRAWDMASEEEAGADWTVGLLMGYDPIEDRVYICDVVRGQWTPGMVKATVQRTAKRDGPNVEILLEQEPGSAGKTVVDAYRREYLLGYFVTDERPTGPKHIRANPFFAAAEEGKVTLVRARWNMGLLDELEDFPGGDHDDQVDSVAYAYNRLCGVRPLSPVVRRRKGSRTNWVDKQKANAVIRGATWGRKF